MIKHLACIMDGNRRWAKKQGRVPWYGHQEGVQAVKKVIEFCLQKKISYLSLYTFSIENFQRSHTEKKYLFRLLVQEAKKGINDFLKSDIRIKFIGDRSLFPKDVLPTCIEVEDATKQCATLQVNFLFCYGSQQEIVGGIKQIAHKIKSGVLSVDQIDQQALKNHLWTAGIPEPELIIRTGGVRRLSNFLLFQAAYTEFYFLDCLWPEITNNHLEDAVSTFSECKRNFGT